METRRAWAPPRAGSVVVSRGGRRGWPLLRLGWGWGWGWGVETAARPDCGEERCGYEARQRGGKFDRVRGTDDDGVQGHRLASHIANVFTLQKKTSSFHG